MDSFQENTPTEWPAPPWWFWILAFLVTCVGILSLSGILLVWYGAQDGAEVVIEAERMSVEAVVEVTGAVKQPGVYSLPPEARWADALARAGGVLATADATYLSKQLALAAPIEDGGKLYIPFASERQGSSGSSTTSSTTQPIAGAGNTASSGGEAEWLSFINTATEAELDELDGVGPKTVSTVLETRPFSTWQEALERTKLTKAQQESLRAASALNTTGSASQ
jgi:DNA uptake protein ComE-like DNA-binding protein